MRMHDGFLSSHHTKLLVSVTNVEEAEMAMQAGADFIDLKDPRAGALGALPIETITAIVKQVNHQRCISATIGDLPMQSEQILPAVLQMQTTGVDIIKIGFFGHDETLHMECLQALKPHTASIRMVAVLFAEHLPSNILAYVQAMSEAGFYGVMVDTALKNGQHLLNHLDVVALAQFIKVARQHQLVVGLAGALRAEHVAMLCAIQPDYLGFRSAVCGQGQRIQPMHRFQLESLIAVLQQCNIRAVNSSS